MIIAIDESGSFAAQTDQLCVFVAVHLRQRRTLYRIKKQQFESWERSLPRSLKSPKGEIKSNLLTSRNLAEFARDVALEHPPIGVTPVAIIPAANPPEVVKKHMEVNRKSIEEGISLYSAQGKKEMAKTYDDFYHWFKKLSYPLYLKIVTLGECIVQSLSNAVGHSIVGKYDEELTRLRFMIDRDFVRSQSHGIFWRELLRSQLWHVSKRHPLPLLNKWKKNGHPFLTKYDKDGRLDLNRLFWDNCDFFDSQAHFEIRIADAVAAIISGHFNERSHSTAYTGLRHTFFGGGRISGLVLEDFDPSMWKEDPEDNPWRKASEDRQ